MAGEGNLYFLEQINIYNKIERKMQRFPCIPFPSTCIALPVVNITHQNSTFLTQDEPTLIHHNHLKLIVLYILWGLDKCILTYPSSYHIECLYCSKNPYWSPSFTFQPSHLASISTVHLIFLLLRATSTALLLNPKVTLHFLSFWLFNSINQLTTLSVRPFFLPFMTAYCPEAALSCLPS